VALSLQQIRDYVREHMDLEPDDLPDTVLDVFIREGSRKVESSEQHWPFYETFFSHVTTAGNPFLLKSAIDPTLKRIQEMTDGENGRPLQWISIAEAEEFEGQSGRPLYISEWGDVGFLFPTPDAAYSFTVFGYRHQLDWVASGAGAVPDMPEPLHNTVALWALHRAYGQQEDPDMASMYRQMFDQELNEQGRRLTEMPLSRPLIMNRRGKPAHRRGRPRFDWE